MSLSLAVFAADAVAPKALGEVDGIMKKLLDIDQEMRSHEATLNSIHQAVMRGEVVVRHLACIIARSFHSSSDRKMCLPSMKTESNNGWMNTTRGLHAKNMLPTRNT